MIRIIPRANTRNKTALTVYRIYVLNQYVDQKASVRNSERVTFLGKAYTDKFGVEWLLAALSTNRSFKDCTSPSS